MTKKKGSGLNGYLRHGDGDPTIRDRLLEKNQPPPEIPEEIGDDPYLAEAAKSVTPFPPTQQGVTNVLDL